MADRDNYVDIVFRNGLKEFEVLPPPDVWKNIQPVLRKRERSLNTFRFAAIAAILVSLSAFSFWLTNGLSKDFTGDAFSLNQEVVPEGSYVAKNKPEINQLVKVTERISEVLMPIAVEEKRSSELIFSKVIPPPNGEIVRYIISPPNDRLIYSG